MWVFGLALTLFSTLGILVGATRKFLGVFALLIFAASLLGAAPIFGKAMQEDHEGPVYSFKVFLIFFGFLLSSGGYMWLLSSIGLDSIELWYLISPCKNELIGEHPSPDGKYKAVLFVRDCEATTV